MSHADDETDAIVEGLDGDGFDDPADDVLNDPTDGALVDDLDARAADGFDDADIDDDMADAHDVLDASTVLVLEEHDTSLVLPVWEPTGDSEVDAALEDLATLEDLSIHDHAEVFTAVHERLYRRLTDISA